MVSVNEILLTRERARTRTLLNDGEHNCRHSLYVNRLASLVVTATAASMATRIGSTLFAPPTVLSLSANIIKITSIVLVLYISSPLVLVVIFYTSAFSVSFYSQSVCDTVNTPTPPQFLACLLLSRYLYWYVLLKTKQNRYMR